MTDKRVPPPGAETLRFPVAEPPPIAPAPQSEIAGDRATPLEPAASFPDGDESQAPADISVGSKQSWNPLSTLRTYLSLQDRIDFSRLPRPKQSPEEFMSTGELRVARLRRYKALLQRIPVLGALGAIGLIAIGWAMSRSEPSTAPVDGYEATSQPATLRDVLPANPSPAIDSAAEPTRPSENAMRVNAVPSSSGVLAPTASPERVNLARTTNSDAARSTSGKPRVARALREEHKAQPDSTPPAAAAPAAPKPSSTIADITRPLVPILE